MASPTPVTGQSPTVGGPATGTRRLRHLRWAVWSLAILVLVTAGVTGGAARPASAYRPGPLPIATGDRATVYYSYGYALLQAVRLHLPELSPYLIVTPSSTRNLELVTQGKAALGFATADTINSLTGTERASLATLARLYDDYLHLVVRRNSGFKELGDLRGRRISVGVAESGTERVAIQLLHAAGIRKVDVKLSNLGVDASADALRYGEIDAFFFFGGVPTGHLEELNLVRPIRLIDLTDWVREARSSFHSQLSIPASTYEGVDPITTLGVPTYLVVSRRMDPDLAYGITAMLFEHRDTMADVHPVVSRLDRRAAINTYPLRLHPGAVRYYQDTHI